MKTLFIFLSFLNTDMELEIEIGCRKQGLFCLNAKTILLLNIPDSKIHGANMGPTWILSAPGGPHIGPWILLCIFQQKRGLMGRLEYPLVGYGRPKMVSFVSYQVTLAAHDDNKMHACFKMCTVFMKSLIRDGIFLHDNYSDNLIDTITIEYYCVLPTNVWW